jgi:hypothetical protein
MCSRYFLLSLRWRAAYRTSAAGLNTASFSWTPSATSIATLCSLAPARRQLLARSAALIGEALKIEVQDEGDPANHFEYYGDVSGVLCGTALTPLFAPFPATVPDSDKARRFHLYDIVSQSLRGVCSDCRDDARARSVAAR